MPRAARSESARGTVGVLDAGVVLARLDRGHASHRKVRELFQRSARGDLRLSISMVNLAEVLQHARQYARETGLDPVALLQSFQVHLHSPDVSIARRAAELASLPDASMADRFAGATAEVLGGRLYTTDRALSQALRPRRILITLL